MRPHTTRLFAICALLCSSAFHEGSNSLYASVFTCDKLSLARPGYGVAYKGVVRNSDYRFSATIPDGLVGWGAAPNAPFHGFTIYPGTDQSSCITFEIHIRVELPEDREGVHGRGKRAKRVKVERVKVGNRRGLQTEETGLASGTEFQNVTVTLELPRSGYYNDVAIRLGTPIKEAANGKALLARFLASFQFFNHD